jgi:hypothetical protein
MYLGCFGESPHSFAHDPCTLASQIMWNIYMKHSIETSEGINWNTETEACDTGNMVQGTCITPLGYLSRSQRHHIWYTHTQALMKHLVATLQHKMMHMW